MDRGTYFHLDFEITAEIPAYPFNRGSIYLFNDQGVYIGLLGFSSESYASFDKNQKIQFPIGFKTGRYSAISWTHMAADSSQEVAPYRLSPSDLILNQTHYDEIELISRSFTRTDPSISRGPACHLYSSSCSFDYDSEQSGSVSLIFHQITKEIEIDLSIFNQDQKESPRDLLPTKVLISCSDRVLDLQGRSLANQPNFHYSPYQEVVISPNNILSSYRKMTLDKHNTAPRLQVLRGDDIVYDHALFTILEATGYPSQAHLDKQNQYHLDVSLSDQGGELEVGIWVNGWKYIPVGGDL
jgi:hypothetical protein